MHKSQELKGVTTRIAVMLQLVNSCPQIGHVAISGKCEMIFENPVLAD